jgi:hypothetical protein
LNVNNLLGTSPISPARFRLNDVVKKITTSRRKLNPPSPPLHYDIYHASEASGSSLSSSSSSCSGGSSSCSGGGGDGRYCEESVVGGGEGGLTSGGGVSSSGVVENVSMINGCMFYDVLYLYTNERECIVEDKLELDESSLPARADVLGRSSFSPFSSYFMNS